MLFSITNASTRTQEHDGLRYIGFVPTPLHPAPKMAAQCGTLRVEGVPGILIRRSQSPGRRFRTTQIGKRRFQPPVVCALRAASESAYVDINAGVTNHLIVLNRHRSTVAYQTGIGPVGDLRKAVQATGTYMNFGISATIWANLVMRPGL